MLRVNSVLSEVNALNEVDILFLNNKMVSELGGGNMKQIIEDVEKAYILLEQGDAISPGKCVMRWGDSQEEENIYGRINAMPGYIGGEYDMAGIKWIGSGPMNYKKGLPRASVIIVLNDPETKLPVCIADGTEISAKRTGATGGIAMNYLAKQNASVMTICGAGVQGRTQLEAALIVRPSIKTVYVYDIKMENAQNFVKEAIEKYPGIFVQAVNSPEKAVRTSDIVVCVTLANQPIIRAEWLKIGTLLMNMADYEVTYSCVQRADKIVVDNLETIKHRNVSTLALMCADGLIHDNDVYANLGQILMRLVPGRENEDEIIYFNAIGIGILDLAIMTKCYKKAIENRTGLMLPYWV